MTTTRYVRFPGYNGKGSYCYYKRILVSKPTLVKFLCDERYRWTQSGLQVQVTLSATSAKKLNTSVGPKGRKFAAGQVAWLPATPTQQTRYLKCYAELEQQARKAVIDDSKADLEEIIVQLAEKRRAQVRLNLEVDRLRQRHEELDTAFHNLKESSEQEQRKFLDGIAARLADPKSYVAPEKEPTKNPRPPLILTDNPRLKELARALSLRTLGAAFLQLHGYKPRGIFNQKSKARTGDRAGTTTVSLWHIKTEFVTIKSEPLPEVAQALLDLLRPFGVTGELTRRVSEDASYKAGKDIKVSTLLLLQPKDWSAEKFTQLRQAVFDNASRKS